MKKNNIKKQKQKKKRRKHVTVFAICTNHRYAIHVWKIVPRNHAVVICSDIFSHVYGSCRFHMFMVHVERSGAGLPFFVGVSTQSPLPSLCLEYGGLQCSHIFIIRCVFIVFIHSLFHFLVPFNVLLIFIYFHFFLFIFISFHFLHFLLFFSLEKAITNLNHLHVDPRLSSADQTHLSSQM